MPRRSSCSARYGPTPFTSWTGFFNGGCDERNADGNDAFVSGESGNSELMPISLETQIKRQIAKVKNI
jgi:hypothetical protein